MTSLRMLIFITIFLVTCFEALGKGKGNLENPSNGGYYGGLQMLSGWVCDAENVEVLIDGAQYLTPSYGMARLDTQSVCGDVNNGFGLVVNLGNLGSGTHEAVLFADGEEIDRSSFFVTKLSTGEFATGLEKCVVVNDFPSDGRDLTLVWSEATQNFQIQDESESMPSTRVEGAWSTSFHNLYFWTSNQRGSFSCEDTVTVYVTGFMNTQTGKPEKIDLVGTGSNGVFDMTSTEDDFVPRDVQFELQHDGSLTMRVVKCTSPLYCRPPEGSVIRFQKELDPIDRSEMPN